MRGELDARDNQLIGVTSELEKLRESRDIAIAKLESELAAGSDKQLTLFPPEPTQPPEPEPTPTPEPEPTPTPTPEPEILKPESTPQPEPNPEPTDTTGTLTRGELVKYIHSSFPGATITGQNIGDCYSFDKKGRLKSSKMPEFEVTYGFKYLGKIDGVSRFQPIPNP